MEGNYNLGTKGLGLMSGNDAAVYLDEVFLGEEYLVVMFLDGGCLVEEYQCQDGGFQDKGDMGQMYQEGGNQSLVEGFQYLDEVF